MKKNERTEVDWDPLSGGLMDPDEDQMEDPMPSTQAELNKQNEQDIGNGFVTVDETSAETLVVVKDEDEQEEEELQRQEEVMVGRQIMEEVMEPPRVPSPLPSSSLAEVTTSHRETPIGLRMEVGESILVNTGNVQYLSPNMDILPGTLRITNYRLHFEPNEEMALPHWLFQDRKIFDVPLCALDKVSRVSNNQVVGGRGKDSLVVHLTCKDFRKLQFRFATAADACRIHDLIRKSAFPVSEGLGVKWLFAFEHAKAVIKEGLAKPTSQSLESPSGFNPLEEWKRQGIWKEEQEDGRASPWRLTDINRAYQFCPTYPSLMIVPSTISDSDLYAVGSFRSKSRIPAMTYYHSGTKGSIWRCSQPKVGIGNTCRQDEQLWASILHRANSTFARIVDCRSYKNALGNKAKGMGYEDEGQYEKTSISFLNISNIHSIRGSMEKLMALVVSSSTSSQSVSSVGSINTPGYNWLASIENTGWLNHLRSILNASITVARYVACNGFPVMVHCSDGWDRTSQVCALAQILLDPHFRTIKGLQVLVEKDWLSFGYQFTHRTGHGIEGGSEEKSPCFLQFIDCVWQLLNQFPTVFEYNEDFLLCLLDHLYSCKFGTFLGNSESERVGIGITAKTISVWDYVAENIDRFLNIYYVKPHPDENPLKHPLLPHPMVVTRQVTLWNKYYLRFAALPSLHTHAFTYLRQPQYVRNFHDPKKEMEAALMIEKQKQKQLEHKIVALRSSVTSLTLGQ